MQTQTVQWLDGETAQSSVWISENAAPAPKRVQLVDDTLSADVAYRLVCEGTGLLWRGDFQNAKLLLQALSRRVEKAIHKPLKASQLKAQAKAPAKASSKAQSMAEMFHAHRKTQAQRSRILGNLIIELQADWRIALRRAPDVQVACTEAWGDCTQASSLVSLQALQGLVGAHEWRKKGVPVPALGADARIHPYFGVFSPLRGEYLELIAKAPLPPELGAHPVAFDIGTGTGVIAAILASKGIARVVGTDLSDTALACAHSNMQRLNLLGPVELLKADLFPPGTAALIVCNPPWIPARPTSTIEHAVYDDNSQMLKGFLNGLAAHLSPGGQGWLILSDLAEHLGLRSREDFLAWVEAAGLTILGRRDARPRHSKTGDASDPLHAARSKEITSLWRLGAANGQ